MIIQKKVEETIREVAKKYNKPYNVILEIFLSEFKMLKHQMNSLEFKTVKFPSWGKYIVSQSKLKKIDYSDKKAKRDNKDGNKTIDGTENNQI